MGEMMILAQRPSILMNPWATQFNPRQYLQLMKMAATRQLKDSMLDALLGEAQGIAISCTDQGPSARLEQVSG